jgi:hypothetical protein
MTVLCETCPVQQDLPGVHILEKNSLSHLGGKEYRYRLMSAKGKIMKEEEKGGNALEEKIKKLEKRKKWRKKEIRK